MKNFYLAVCLSLFLFSNSSVIGQNQFEPNNSCSTAYSIDFDLDYEAAIQEAFDEDYYEITVPTEGLITIQITGISDDYQIAATLFDEDCINVVESGSSGLGNNLIMYEKICNPGVYKLELKDSGTQGVGQWSSDLYTLLVTLDTSDIYETDNCNDECGDAIEIQFGEEIQAAIADEYDEDFFMFDVPTEGVINIQITGISDDYEMFAFLYDDINCMNEIEQEYEPSENFLVMYEKTCSPGKHILRLKDGGGSNTNDWSPQLYTLTVTLDTSDIYETNNCNDECGDAIEIGLGEEVQAAISDEYDEDFFMFDVPTEGVIKVKITGISDDYEMFAFLYDDINCINEIEQEYEPSENFLVMYEKACSPGAHILRLKDGGGSNTNDWSPQLYTLTVTLDTSDIYETNNCNDEQISAFQLPQICIDTFYAAINEVNDQDFFQFSVPANSIINIDIKNIPSNIDMSAELTNGSNTVSDQANNGNPISLALNNSSQSTYTLHLNDSGNNDFNESLYQLCIQVLPQVDLMLSNEDFCISDAPFALSGGNPAGGIYSGIGVDSLGVFNPSIAGIGEFEITYTYTDTSYSCSNQTSQSITVHPLPTGSFTSTVDTVFLTDASFMIAGGMPIGGIYNGVGVDSILGEFDPIVAGIGTHEITYTVTDGFGCSSQFIDSITVVQVSSVISLSSDTEISISPNPFSETINIRAEKLIGTEIGIDIFNLNGTLIYSLPHRLIGENIEIDLADYPSGIYIVRFEIGETTYSAKIIKE